MPSCGPEQDWRRCGRLDAVSSPHRHGVFFRDVFSDPKNLAAHALSILPASAVARLHFERLTVRAEREVDEALRAFETDLIALVTLVETSEEASGAFIYVLVEHQSTRDPFMALRVLTYIGQVWPTWHSDHPKARTLPLVVSIVVYNGERPWTASLTVHGRLPTLNGPPELRAFVPNVTLLLDDLSRQSDDDLRQRVMVSAMGPTGAVALEALKHVHDAEVDARAIDWVLRVLRVSRATADNDPDFRAVVRLLHSLFDAPSGIFAETLKAIASAPFSEHSSCISSGSFRGRSKRPSRPPMNRRSRSGRRASFRPRLRKRSSPGGCSVRSPVSG